MVLKRDLSVVVLVTLIWTQAVSAAGPQKARVMVEKRDQVAAAQVVTPTTHMKGTHPSANVLLWAAVGVAVTVILMVRFVPSD